MKIKIPTNCPMCDGDLELVNQQLFCKNIKCAAKSSKKLLHYAKTMKIMGLGEKTLEKLEVNSIPDLYTLSEFTVLEKLGDKVGTKILAEIGKTKTASFSTFLSAMSIPLIGRTASDKVQNNISSPSLLSEEVCKKSGLGPKATDNLMKWFIEEYDNYRNLPIEFDEAEKIESGIVVCISGKIPGHTKATLKELLSDYNVTVVDNVTKAVDYLITEEQDTSKVKKAEQYNIQIISFDKFMEKINE
jgi:DNA ligase (NAD+)